jgi:SAM-dependent methyltransferase
LDLGAVALAGAFLKPEQFAAEQRYPLELCLCHNCFLLQVVNVVPKDTLFQNYFYFSSAIQTLRDHFENRAREMCARFLSPGRSFVVEIGCNDGVLLRPLQKLGIRVLGVDPATNIVRALEKYGISVLNDYFTEEIAGGILRHYGPADCIVANNVFAHIDDLHDVTRGIYKLLKPDGVFIFEIHYAGSVIEELQYDMIYHEHLSYYSTLALESLFSQFNMEIFDVQAISIHAGSKRYYVRKKGRLTREKNIERVQALCKSELHRGYDRAETYFEFARQVQEKRVELRETLERLKEPGRYIVGYGASGRANTVIQYCELEKGFLDYMVDDAPAKHGFYTPGSHLPIYSSEILRRKPVDYVVVFAWAFLEEIKKRCCQYLGAQSRIVIPLPEVKVVSVQDMV